MRKEQILKQIVEDEALKKKHWPDFETPGIKDEHYDYTAEIIKPIQKNQKLKILYEIIISQDDSVHRNWSKIEKMLNL